MQVTTEDRLFQLAAPTALDTARPERGSRALRTVIRAAGGTFTALAVVAALGAAYETIAGSGDPTTYPPAGRLVDVGGYRLHLDCRGEGSPTVVMDAGLGRASLDWSLVQPQIATTTQVCTYDRAGMGWSEPGPLPRTPGQIAGELRMLLTNAGVPGPYVLVGHSLAGKNIRMFASAYPDDLVGMVLVDARSELVDRLTPKAEADGFGVALGLQGTLYSLARHLGVARAFGASLAGVPLLPADIAAEMALLQTQTTAIDETTKEGLARADDDEVLAKSALGSRPLVVVAAAASMANIPNWSTAQQEMAALSTQGSLVIAEHSGHAVQLEQPGIVVDAIDDVVAKVRADY
jgi:pimeloyl-ACP methyl ester carboxylesterase